MSLESDMQKYHPLAMQKEAEELALRCDRQKKEKIQFLLIYRSGVMRGHGKTPPFRTGMKCLPHRHIPLRFCDGYIY